MEYCAGGSIEKFLSRYGKLPIDLARHFTAEIVNSLEYLRTMQVVHRDLKPGNIVLEKDYHLKLIDFGTCKVYQP